MMELVDFTVSNQIQISFYEPTPIIQTGLFLSTNRTLEPTSCRVQVATLFSNFGRLPRVQALIEKCQKGHDAIQFVFDEFLRTQGVEPMRWNSGEGEEFLPTLTRVASERQAEAGQYFLVTVPTVNGYANAVLHLEKQVSTQVFDAVVHCCAPGLQISEGTVLYDPTHLTHLPTQVGPPDTAYKMASVLRRLPA